MSKDLADVLVQIRERVDPEELIDRLGLSTEELCDILVDHIGEKLYKFEDIYDEQE